MGRAVGTRPHPSGERRADVVVQPVAHVGDLTRCVDVACVGVGVGGGRLCAVGPGRWDHRGPGGGVRGRALLVMLADTMLPEAHQVEGVLTDPLVVVGFAVSIAPVSH
jgi:hypothetical protein